MARDDQTTRPPQSARALASAAGFGEVPAELGRYRIERELGRGAMGAVYLALDTGLNRLVALKVPQFSAQENPELIERFLREARAAGALAHPNLCRVYDVFEHRGLHYIAMEYIDGSPLAKYVTAEGMPPRYAANVIRKLAQGLAEAHQRGIIHRDLKPDNVILNRSGEPVLTDFGLAREASATSATTTQEGVLLGSPAYMSPEQAAGKVSELGPASDIYSLGVVLYQLLTGELPFRGSPMEVVAQVVLKTPRKVREVRPEVPAALAEICDRMMARRPAERFASMTDVSRALSGWLKQSTGSDDSPGQTMAPHRTMVAETAASPPSSGDRPAPVFPGPGESDEEVRRLEQRLEELLAAADLAGLKSCTAKLLNLRPAHRRAIEIRKVLKRQGREGIQLLARKSEPAAGARRVSKPLLWIAGLVVVLGGAAMMNLVASLASRPAHAVLATTDTPDAIPPGDVSPKLIVSPKTPVRNEQPIVAANAALATDAAPAVLQERILWESFGREEEIAKEWTFLNSKWRLENGGIKLTGDGGLKTKTEFHGDFSIDVYFSGNFEIVAFGEYFGGEPHAKNSSGTLTRRGDQLTYTPSYGGPVTVTLKKSQTGLSTPIEIRNNRRWQSEVLVRSIRIRGQAAGPTRTGEFFPGTTPKTDSPPASPSAPPAKTVLKEKIVSTAFSREDEITPEWTFLNSKWRLENGAIKLTGDGGVKSRAQFLGDFSIDVSFTGNFEIVAFGEYFGGEPHPKNVSATLTRRGNQLTYSPIWGQAVTITLKKSQENQATSIELRNNRRWQSEAVVRRIWMRGTVAEPAGSASAPAKPAATGYFPGTTTTAPGKTRPAHVPADAVFWKDHWYWFPDGKVSYREAVAAAERKKGRLILVTSAEENQFLAGRLRGPTFLGMTKKQGRWVGVDGVQQRYFNWDKGQPQSSPGENWAAMLKGGKWHDYLEDRLYYAVEWTN